MDYQTLQIEKHQINPQDILDNNLKIISSHQGSTGLDAFAYMKLLINDNKFDKAHFILLELKKTDESSFIKNPLDEEIIKDLESIYKEIIYLTSQMDLEQEWNTEKLKAGDEHVTLKYKKFPSSSLYGLKYEATIQVPIFNLCALIYEVDLFNKWIPFCSHSKTIKKINRSFKIAYFLLDLPFIYNREAYIKGIGVDRLDENGTILILSGSVDVDNNFQKKHDLDIPENPKTVRLDLKTCGMEIRPETRNKFKIKVVSSCDPKVAFLPDFILNFCVRKGGSYFFDKMIGIAKNMEGSEWEKRIKSVEDRDFYSWVEERLDSYFKTKNFKN